MNEGILDTAKDIWEYSSKLNENVYEFIDKGFEKNGYPLSTGKSGGPLINSGIRSDSYIEYYNEEWFVLIVGVKIENLKSIDIRIAPTYDHKYMFSTCPFFYKLYKTIYYSIDISGIRTTNSLEKRVNEEILNIVNKLEEAKKQFKIDFNDLMSKAENSRGYSCILDTKDKKEMLSKLLNDENLLKIYELTKDDSFLPQEAKDIFLF